MTDEKTPSRWIKFGEVISWPFIQLGKLLHFVLMIVVLFIFGVVESMKWAWIPMVYILSLLLWQVSPDTMGFYIVTGLALAALFLSSAFNAYKTWDETS